MNTQNSATVISPSSAQANRRVEDTAGKSKDVNSGKSGKAEETDYSAVAAAVTDPQREIQDTPESRFTESQETVKACGSSDQQGAVGILEGFEELNDVSDGTGILDFVELFQDEIMAESIKPETEPVLPDLFSTEQAAVGSLENTNSTSEQGVDVLAEGEQTQTTDPLLSMLQQAAMRANKARQGGAGTEGQRQQGSDSNAATTETPFESMVTSAPERPFASTPVETGTPSTEQVTQADTLANINNIVEQIEANVADAKQEFTVQLKPEFLGRLSIKLIMDDDGIRAQIKAQDMNTKSMILHELPMLEETLKDRGIAIRDIDVTYEAAQFDFNPRQQMTSNWSMGHGGTAGGRESSVYAAGRETSFGLFDVTGKLDPYIPDHSSMEFSA